ncbi:MAG TPA: hypothetical protein VL361_12350 [Candidatus Limnocylindrales bacterium]|nr:hypothetical protein [Candidatus Limnocylindrales bacterium]
MKGISVLLSFVLLVLAHELARYLRKCGTLPSAQVSNRQPVLHASHT